MAAAFFLLLNRPATAQIIAPPMGAPATPVIYSVQQCIDSALSNNPTVKLSEFTKRGAKVGYYQQIGLMLPSLYGTANYLNNGGKSINNFNNTYVTENYNQGVAQLYGSVTIWNGLSIHNYIKQYSLAYEADKLDWQYAKDQLTINVILSYLTILSTEEQLALAGKQVAANRHRVELMQIQDSLGAISPTDFTDMKGQLNTSELTVVNTRNTLEANKLALAQLMNVPYTPEMELVKLGTDLTPVVYNASVDQVYENAARNLPVIKAAGLHVESAAKAVKANRGNMMPTLSFQYYLTTNYSTAASLPVQVGNSYYALDPNKGYVTVNGTNVQVYTQQSNTVFQPISFATQYKNNVYTQFGLYLSIPLLNHLNYRTLYNQSRVNYDQAVFNQKTAVNSLRQAVESNFVTMSNAFRTYTVLNSQVQNYEESFRGAQIKYDAGALKSLDFVIYNTNKDQAELNLIAAKYAYILQTKILDYYQGQLTW